MWFRDFRSDDKSIYCQASTGSAVSEMVNAKGQFTPRRQTAKETSSGFVGYVLTLSESVSVCRSLCSPVEHAALNLVCLTYCNHVTGVGLHLSV